MGHFISAHNKFFNRYAQGQGWMSADFDVSQTLVKRAEGGYSIDPRDAGNYTGGKVGIGDLIGTNWGISAPTLVSELKRLGGAPPTASTMKNLQYASAIAIYKRNYWDTIKGNEIKNQTLANIIYDESVNSGVGAAKRTVKDSLGISSYDVNAINNANQAKLANNILSKRKAAYEKEGGYALDSWLDRLDKLKIGIQQNTGKTVIIILGLGVLIGGGIYLYKRS